MPEQYTRHVDTTRAGEYHWHDWNVTPYGKNCLWCGDNPDYEPGDDVEAAEKLCRGHLAEFTGVSIDGLDRAERAAHADMEALGYFD